MTKATQVHSGTRVGKQQGVDAISPAAIKKNEAVLNGFYDRVKKLAHTPGTSSTTRSSSR